MAYRLASAVVLPGFLASSAALSVLSLRRTAPLALSEEKFR